MYMIEMEGYSGRLKQVIDILKLKSTLRLVPELVKLRQYFEKEHQSFFSQFKNYEAQTVDHFLKVLGVMRLKS